MQYRDIRPERKPCSLKQKCIIVGLKCLLSHFLRAMWKFPGKSLIRPMSLCLSLRGCTRNFELIELARKISWAYRRTSRGRGCKCAHSSFHRVVDPVNYYKTMHKIEPFANYWTTEQKTQWQRWNHLAFSEGRCKWWGWAIVRAAR